MTRDTHTPHLRNVGAILDAWPILVAQATCGMLARRGTLAVLVVAALLGDAIALPLAAHAGDASSPRALIGGYGEMHASVDDGARLFALDRMVLFVGAEFSDHLRLESETELEDGKEIEVEQAYLEWDVASRLRMQSGLVLLPVSRLNLTHEPPTYLTVQRPALDTVILPSTWRDAGVRLSYQAADALTLDLAVTNGLDAHGLREEDGFRGGRQNGVGVQASGTTTVPHTATTAAGGASPTDSDETGATHGVLMRDLGTTLRATWTPRLGVSLAATGYTSKAGQGDARLAAVRASLVAVDMEADRAGWKVRVTGGWGFLAGAEDVRTVTAEAVGTRFHGIAAEVGYDVLRLLRPTTSGARLLPYVRWEQTDPRSAVPASYGVVATLKTTTTTLGVAFLPTRQTVVKAAMVHSARHGEAADTGAQLGLGWMF